jgi:hypothetical protein
VGAARATNWIDQNLDGAIKVMASENRRQLLGTQFPDVSAAMLTSLVSARVTANPQGLVAAMVLSVYVAFTISRDWTGEYAGLAKPHPFVTFELDGRTATQVKQADGTVKVVDGWVTTSVMNSTALHLAGHMIIDAAPSGGVFARVKEIRGTIFNPPSGAVDTEQAKLMRAANKTLTMQDRAARDAFASEFAKLLPIVDALFGAAGANVEMALAAAKRVALEEF